MSDHIEDGGLAFPVAEDHRTADELPWTAGMSLRDWFAGQALKWAGHGEFFHQDPEHAARRAYQMADAMLAARKGGQS